MSNEFKMISLPLELMERVVKQLSKSSLSPSQQNTALELVGAISSSFAAAPQPPALGEEPETAAWLDLEKLKIGNMAYATGMKVNHLQTELIDRAHLAPLQAEIGHLRRQYQEMLDQAVAVMSERDQLKARGDELEGLLREAHKYAHSFEQIPASCFARIDAALSKPAGSEQV